MHGDDPIPLSPHAPTESNPDSESRGGALAHEPSTPIKLLIVEDEFLVALDAESVLRERGFNVVGLARTGAEAIALAGATRPALVLMDIRLASAQDGVDAAVEIFERFGIRSLFATAHDDEATRRRATRAQPLGWLQKPYSPSALFAAVSQALSES